MGWLAPSINIRRHGERQGCGAAMGKCVVREESVEDRETDKRRWS